MALRPCRECGAQVSTEADTCPHCGIAQPANADSLINVRPGRDPINYPQKKRKRWGLWLGVATVSYTHLDVYKRQASARASDRGSNG